MGWGDAPGASPAELAAALAEFDPEGRAHARGRDPVHRAWFAEICKNLLPGYAYSLGWDTMLAKRRGVPEALPVMAVRRGMPPYSGAALEWPPGWIDGWAHHGYHRVLRRAAQG